MKKIISVVLIAVMFFAIAVPVAASEDVKVVVGGKAIKFDVKPRIINGRTMVPLRAIFEALGATVDWDDTTKTVTSKKGDTTIKLTVNRASMEVNGERVQIDSAACIIGGRTLVPVRAISEAFQLKVDWDDGTNTVIIRNRILVSSEDSDGTSQVYDENGNIIYCGFADGSWEKYSYDESGKVLNCETSSGQWYYYTYDAKGNETYYEKSDGSWKKTTYDESGNPTYIETSDGGWIKLTYDEDGNINALFNDGSEAKTTYSEADNMLIYETTDGYWEKTTYDEKGNTIYFENSDSYWEKTFYDEKGNIKDFETSDGKWDKYTYNENGDLAYKDSSDGSTTEYIYDENRNLISEKGKDYLKNYNYSAK